MTISWVGASIIFPIAALGSLGASFLLVSRLERMADRLGLSEAMVGLVVALAADAPEITSAVTASAHGRATVGAGIVLGSNVFNLAALLGLGAIVAGKIGFHRRVVALEGLTGAWVALSTVAVVVAGLGPGLGLALTAAAVLPYVAFSASPILPDRLGLSARPAEWLRRARAEEELELSTALDRGSPRPRDGLVALGVLIAVVVASTLMEGSAETVGRHFHLSALVVGGLVLAAVTSLPNAVGAVYLASRRRGPALLSEAMNSNMLNVAVGLFLPGIFIAGHGPGGAGDLAAAWYAGLTVASLAVAFLGRGLRRRDGIAILASYFVFVAVVILQ